MAVLFLLTACQNSAAVQGRKIADLCTQKMNFAAGVCQCVGDKAVTDLTDDERKMVISLMDKDNANAGDQIMNLPMGQVIKTGSFVAATGAACAAQALQK